MNWVPGVPMMATSNTDDATVELGLPENDSAPGTALDNVIDFVLPEASGEASELNSQVQKIETRVNHVEYKVNAVHERVEEISSRPETSITISPPPPQKEESAPTKETSKKTLEDLTAELSNYL